MDLDLRDLAILVLSVLLAASAFRMWMGSREVQVIQESEYTQGLPRAFVRVRLRSDGNSDGTYLADDTGKPIQFVGCRAVQIQNRFKADGRTAQVAVLLDGVKILRRNATHASHGETG